MGIPVFFQRNDPGGKTCIVYIYWHDENHAIVQCTLSIELFHCFSAYFALYMYIISKGMISLLYLNLQQESKTFAYE